MHQPPVIGIIGGGQLGRMFIEEALRYNVKCIIVDADKNCPASLIAHDQIVGSISEEGPIFRLSELTDILTYEIEHIYIKPLLKLEKDGRRLIPSPQILQMVQDKGLQKLFYAEHQIPTAPFVLVDHENEWNEAIVKMGWKKFAAKLRKSGYDGKGVEIMNAEEGWQKNIPFKAPTLLEEFIPCKKEISVIVARNRKGELSCFPPAEMEFDPVANLVTWLVCPAKISENISSQASQIAKDLVEKMNGIGLFAVEMFLDENDRLLVNEMAPRPHNSGHHTIEACYTSQYEQLLRVLLDLPLGSTELIKPAVMLNILGATDFSGEYFLDGYDEILKMEGVYVHLYGKKESRPMRKLGHVTVLGNTVEEAREKAQSVKNKIAVCKLNGRRESFIRQSFDEGAQNSKINPNA
jgi:5-(carboxyamino)imidazole ribonucleotide synthase